MFLVVFVCTGNTCRSPMAAAIARREWCGRGVGIDVGSAGTNAIAGQPASNHALFVVAERGGDLTSHASRPIDGDSMDSADLIVTMTRGHQQDLQRRFPDHLDRIVTLAELAGQPGDLDIPDPFGGSLEDYESTHERIAAHIRAATPVVCERARAAASA